MPTIRTLLLTALVAMLGSSATPAMAQLAPGVAIRWDQCYSEGGTINHNFACNANAGARNLIGSFSPQRDLIYMERSEIVLDLAAASGAWPAWWAAVNAGTCRQSSIVFDTVSPPELLCADWASGQASGTVSYAIGSGGPNRARFLAAFSVPIFAPTTYVGAEYFAFRLRITNAKTVGTGACTGCDVPMCLVFNSIKVTELFHPELDQILTNPINGTDSHYATWQGGGTPTTSLGTGCPAATPTRRGTWGSVKALYR